jgi:hypothetical protein
MMLQWNDVNNNQYIEAYPWTIHKMSKASFSILHTCTLEVGTVRTSTSVPKNFLPLGSYKSYVLSIFSYLEDLLDDSLSSSL